MFTKKTINDIDVRGKKILLHAELDAPLSEDGRTVTSDYRIQSAVPTIKYLQDKDCKIILISKLGRPEGKRDLTMSLAPVAKQLSELLKQDVPFVDDCLGDKVKTASDALQPRGVIMLENVRYYPEEEKNDPAFAQKMVEATGAEIFVQDCFALAHRTESTTEAITHLLPSVAGLHLEQEVDTITRVMDTPERPLMAIIGGAKISDKIDVLNRFIEIADFIAVGGAMANTFLAAEGIDVSKSKYEKNDIPIAKDLLTQAREKSKKERFIFYVPQDGVVAKAMDKTAETRIVDWDAHVIAQVESYPHQPAPKTRTIADDEMILDIGPFSGAFIAGGIQLANTVVWNGTMGVTETPALQGAVGPFARGTELLIDAILGDYGHRPFSLVGGGDTVGYIEQRKLTGAFNHVSTGGGASLELMAGRKLPAVEALQDK